MSMSAHDFSTIPGATSSAVGNIRAQQQAEPPQPQVPATAVAQPADSRSNSSTGAATGPAAAGGDLRTDSGTSTAQVQGSAAGNSSNGASAEPGAGLHFDMSLSELDTFDFGLYDE